MARPNKTELDLAVQDYLAAATSVRREVLESTPAKLSLLRMCLNKLAKMVQAGGYRDSRGAIRVLTPKDLDSIIRSVGQAYTLESNLAGLPFGFGEASDYLAGIHDDGKGAIDANSGLSELPDSPLRPIDATPIADAIESD